MLIPWLLFTPRRAPDRTMARHRLALPFMYAKRSTGKQRRRHGYLPLRPSLALQKGLAGEAGGRTAPGGQVPTDTQEPCGSGETSMEDVWCLPRKDSAVSPGMPFQSFSYKRTEEGSATEGKTPPVSAAAFLCHETLQEKALLTQCN